MANYANPTLVYARDSGRTFTANTKPSTQMVLDFLEETAAELDGILRARGYAIPVATTATSALKALENMNVLGAAALVEMSSPAPAGKRGDAFKLWDDARKMLAAGEIELDAGRDSAQGIPRQSTVGSAIFYRGEAF